MFYIKYFLVFKLISDDTKNNNKFGKVGSECIRYITKKYHFF